jgi:hypothetical protein
MSMHIHMASHGVQAALLRKCPKCGELKKTALSQVNETIPCPKCEEPIPPKRRLGES